MNAPKPRDALDAAAIGLFRQMDYREQCAWRNAFERIIDGQPFEDAMVEAAVELGAEPQKARSAVQAAWRNKGGWRSALN